MTSLRRILLAALLAAGVASANAADEMAKTLPYEPGEALLTGRLVRRVFPGPPNYESVAKGDRTERPILLELDHSVDVSHPDFPQEDPRTVRSIQVRSATTGDPKEEAALEKLVASAVGKEVVVKATLSVAMTGHHHTPVIGEIRRLKRKGAADFPPLPHQSPQEKAAAAAEQLRDREKLLSEVTVVDGTTPDADFTGYTRFVGTLVERRMRAASSWEFWIKNGMKICWILQLEQPVTIRATREANEPEPIPVRELDVIFPFEDALAQRDLRALGVTAADAWDPACKPLFGKRYEVVGRLFPNSRYDRAYAEARLHVDRIQAANER